MSGCDKVTVQWSIISESLNRSHHKKGSHGYGSLVRGANGAEYSFHHNLWAHHRDRTPRPGNYRSYKDDPKGLTADFSNNVIYNWGGPWGAYNSDEDAISCYNFRSNSFKPGPDSKRNSFIFREQCAKATAHFAGNHLNGKPIGNDWRLIKFQFRKRFGKSDRELIAAYKQADPIKVAAVTVDDAAIAGKQVLAQAGALPRDAVDQRVVKSVKNGTGKIIDSQKQVGGWPRLKAADAAADTDRDGMADAWETEHGLDPEDPADAVKDKDKDGFTNLEDYLNERAERLLNEQDERNL